MSQKINFSDYTASGVYFMEIDNSIIYGTSVQAALRLVVGFNMRGPFNRPVYIDNTDTCDKLFGGIDRKLERRGCFTNRSVRTMISKAPMFVLNLLSVNTTSDPSNPDVVGATIFSLSPTDRPKSFEYSSLYADMYDRSKFWIVDEKAFVDNTFLSASIEDASLNGVDIKDQPKTIEECAMFGMANCGTKDISVIIRKSENVQGYNLSFLDYYGNEDSIPYPWINPSDFVSDYFVDVYIIAGNWDESKYSDLAGDVVWRKYFTEDGLKKDSFKNFLRLDAVNLIASYTGCVIPNFIDKQGNTKSIDYLINKSSNETGLVFGFNEKAMDAVTINKNIEKSDDPLYFVDKNGTGVYEGDALDGDVRAQYAPDFVGHLIDPEKIEEFDSSVAFTYLSANIEIGEYDCSNYNTFLDGKLDSSTVDFCLDGELAKHVDIGDYVRGIDGFMTKIIKKRGLRVENENENSLAYYRFTAAGAVNGKDASGNVDIKEHVEIHKSYTQMYKTLKIYSLPGLKLSNRHLPGYDASGNFNEEAGVEKIYGMLETDPGIRRGLLNDDSIDFRYIVDTMAYGLKENCGGKRHLARLAKEKGHCTAIINAPSMSQFASSDAPFFGDDWVNKESDPRPTFDVKYIPEGGNQNMVYPNNTESFTLPDFDGGADHIGVFGPFFKYTEGNRLILVPPAADVCNTFMNKFTGGDPYAVVANTNGIINNPYINGVEYELDKDERGYLETMGINPIINRNGNVMIFGDKTAYQIVNSDLSYLHVREILNTIEISCKSVLDDYVFKYNIPTTRSEIVMRLNPILSAMRDSGALVRYEIECDDFNNTKDVIDNKFCIVDIGVWISQSMEKIVVPITINRSTTA